LQTTCSHRTTFSWLQNDPQLAQAILGDDINELQNILRSRHQQRMELKRKQEEELVRISLLNFYSLSKRLCKIKWDWRFFLHCLSTQARSLVNFTFSRFIWKIIESLYAFEENISCCFLYTCLKTLQVL
jgi:hypothetical protein